MKNLVTREKSNHQSIKQQMKEFASEQRAVENIKVANKQMEAGKRDKSLEAKRLVKDEYDMVPTRLKPVSATANGLTFTTQMEPSKSRSALPRESRIPA